MSIVPKRGTMLMPITVQGCFATNDRSALWAVN